MNPNHGKYLEVVQHHHDGCQWNPIEDRGALVSDRHFRQTRATWVVGSSPAGREARSGIEFRLCDSCARLPRWNKLGQRRERIVDRQVR